MNRRRLVLEIILIFSAFFLTGYLGQGDGQTARLPEISTAVPPYLLLAVPQILLTLYIIAIQKETALSDFGVVPPSRRDPLRILLVFLGVLALLVPFIIAALFLPDGVREALGRGYRWRLQAPSQLPIAFVFAVVAGYREELFFRSYLLTRLAQIGAPAWAAVAGTALLFSMGHLYEGPAGLAVTAIQGVYLGIVFLRMKSLHVVAAVHGLYNFAVLCMSLFIGDTGLPGNAILITLRGI